jgi:hypothetical protein
MSREKPSELSEKEVFRLLSHYESSGEKLIPYSCRE